MWVSVCSVRQSFSWCDPISLLWFPPRPFPMSRWKWILEWVWSSRLWWMCKKCGELVPAWCSLRSGWRCCCCCFTWTKVTSTPTTRTTTRATTTFWGEGGQVVVVIAMTMTINSFDGSVVTRRMPPRLNSSLMWPPWWGRSIGGVPPTVGIRSR